MLKPLMFILILTLLQSAQVNAEIYTYKDITANTEPTRYCYSLKEGSKLASDIYTVDRNSKLICNTLGVGWHVDKRVTDGKVTCKPCTGEEEGRHQCYMENLIITCKHLNPLDQINPSNQKQ